MSLLVYLIDYNYTCKEEVYKVYTSTVLAKIKDAIYAKGFSTIRSLAICFKHFDSVDGNRKLSKEEFYDGLKSFDITLTKAELDVCYLYRMLSHF